LVFFGGLKKGRLIFGYWVNDSRTHSGLNLPKSGGVPLVVGKREASAAIFSKMSLTTEFTMHMDSVVDADPDPDFI
jgi:hypothetical protein